MKRIILFLVTAMAVLSAITACAQKRGNKVGNATKPKTLVVYFSVTGTTEGAAKKVALATNGKLYKIQPEKKYSSTDLNWRVKSSRCQREQNDPQSRPAILKSKEKINSYDTIYLGYPIWCNMAPKIINSFIESANLKGKTVIPFCTSGGSSIDNSVKILKKTYPYIKWQKGMRLNGATQNEINKWVKK